MRHLKLVCRFECFHGSRGIARCIVGLGQGKPGVRRFYANEAGIERMAVQWDGFFISSASRRKRSEHHLLFVAIGGTNICISQQGFRLVEPIDSFHECSEAQACDAFSIGVAHQRSKSTLRFGGTLDFHENSCQIRFEQRSQKRPIFAPLEKQLRRFVVSTFVARRCTIDSGFRHSWIETPGGQHQLPRFHRVATVPPQRPKVCQGNCIFGIDGQSVPIGGFGPIEVTGIHQRRAEVVVVGRLARLDFYQLSIEFGRFDGTL